MCHQKYMSWTVMCIVSAQCWHKLCHSKYIYNIYNLPSHAFHLHLWSSEKWEEIKVGEEMDKHLMGNLTEFQLVTGKTF